MQIFLQLCQKERVFLKEIQKDSILKVKLRAMFCESDEYDFKGVH